MIDKVGVRTKLVSALVAGGILVAVALAVSLIRPAPVRAWATPPCDFLTGGGWIVHLGAKANFAIGGGCKHGSPTWGHLEYIDHGTGLNVHGTDITGYFFIDQGTGVDPKTQQPTGTIVYETSSECTFHYLGSYAPCSPGTGGGGNIQLHKPNPSTTGSFGGTCPAYPAFAGG